MHAAPLPRGAGLSRFTLLILFITKLGPGEDTGGSMGLMFTGGGK